MDDFTRIKPQWVRHASGYEVRSVKRHRVEYVADGRTATVEVDLTDHLVPVYAATLAWTDSGEPLTAQERAAVGPRVVAGLAAMGYATELVG